MSINSRVDWRTDPITNWDAPITKEAYFDWLKSYSEDGLPGLDPVVRAHPSFRNDMFMTMEGRGCLNNPIPKQGPKTHHGYESHVSKSWDDPPSERVATAKGG